MECAKQVGRGLYIEMRVVHPGYAQTRPLEYRRGRVGCVTILAPLMPSAVAGMEPPFTL